MPEESRVSTLSWGAQINTTQRLKARIYPDWANPRQREKWAESGLIVWEKETPSGH